MSPLPTGETRTPEVLGLDRLHAEQRDAVTHGEGPLLIVAGAGTGKTQVVTHRIAWLISSKKARPEQILALIEEDVDIGILILGASTDTRGPGPLVSSLAAGRYAGTFPIPITIVPGGLKPEDIATLA